MQHVEHAAELRREIRARGLRRLAQLDARQHARAEERPRERIRGNADVLGHRDRNRQQRRQQREHLDLDLAARGRRPRGAESGTPTPRRRRRPCCPSPRRCSRTGRPASSGNCAATRRPASAESTASSASHCGTRRTLRLYTSRVARRGNPARLVIALSVAGVLAIFLLYTSIAGGGTPSFEPEQAGGTPGARVARRQGHRAADGRRARHARCASACATATAPRACRSSTAARFPTSSRPAARSSWTGRSGRGRSSRSRARS